MTTHLSYLVVVKKSASSQVDGRAVGVALGGGHGLGGVFFIQAVGLAGCD